MLRIKTLTINDVADVAGFLSMLPHSPPHSLGEDGGVKVEGIASNPA
jgi:hypothetical protein